MAVARDIIETVLTITGAAGYIANMASAAAGTSLLAAAQAGWNATLEVSIGLLSLINLPLLITGTALAGLAATLGLATQALRTFAGETKRLFETGVILKNIGSSLTLPQVRQYAEATSRATGFLRPDIEQGAGRIARTGVGGEQIRNLLPIIADTARATGRTFEEVSEKIQKGILGSTRAVKEFGITLIDTGSRAANLAIIQRQLELRFAGAAVAFRETLPGAIDAFHASLQRFFSNLGDKFAPVAIRVLNALTSVIDFLADHVLELSDAIATILGGPVGFFLNRLAQAADAGKNPLEKVGVGGEPATEATAQQIADNTKLIADSVEQQILGGPGEVVRQQFGYLQARIALQI